MTYKMNQLTKIYLTPLDKYCKARVSVKEMKAI